MADKVALFTGCSSGIGHHCALAMLRRGGWRIFASARAEADVSRLRDSGLTALQLDLDDSDSIRSAVDELLRQTDGRLDILFNNGAYGQPGATEDLSRRALREQFETNVFGTQELTNAIIPIMRRQGSGRIIQNSSVLGFVPMRYRGAYNASKYALEGLSDTMRLELAGSGIHIILIEPGPITSDFRKNATKRFQRHFNEDAISASIHADYYRGRLNGKEDSAPPPFNLGPEAVQRALLHAMESARPKLRYRVTVPTHIFWWGKRLLPTRLLDSILRRIA